MWNLVDKVTDLNIAFLSVYIQADDKRQGGNKFFSLFLSIWLFRFYIQNISNFNGLVIPQNLNEILSSF